MLLVDRNKLEDLARKADPAFEAVFSQLRQPAKGELRPLLVYVDKVLAFMLGRDIDGIRCTQLHFPQMKDDYKHGLLEFITIRTFYDSFEYDRVQDDHIHDRLAILENRIKLNRAPEDARAVKGGNAIYRRWLAERKSLSEEARFLRSLADSRKSLWPACILNVQTGDQPVIHDGRYTITLEELEESSNRAYCLLNTDLSLTELIARLMPLGRLDTIRQVILFDCDGRRAFGSFHQRDLENVIKRKYPVKDLVILSFDKRPFRLVGLMNRLKMVYRNYFQPLERPNAFKDTYVFRQEEMEWLIYHRVNTLSIHWIGGDSELFAEYLDLLADHGIDQLRKPAVLNIYSGASSAKMGEYLINHLFGPLDKEGLFDTAVRTQVNGLDASVKAELLRVTRQLLALIAQLWDAIKMEMRRQAKKGSVGIVISPALRKVSIFRAELKAILPDLKVNIHTWRDIRDGNCKDPLVFILAYRDPGRYPFLYHPSLVERGAVQTANCRPLLLTMFFAKRYARIRHYYALQVNEILKNRFRYQYLDWRAVEARLSSEDIPVQEDAIMEDEEDDEMVDGVDPIKVDLVDGGHATLYPSRLILAKSKVGGRLNVMRADDLPMDVEGWAIQLLDELYEDFNLFPITPGEEKELQSIKTQYGVEDETQVLWKVMLARRVQEGQDSRVLYASLEDLFGQRSFIKYDYFKEHWLNVGSKLLTPRKRRHFKLLCEHLGLGKAYYRLKLKKSSSLRANSRESHMKMNSLLSQMIEEGLFEQGVDWKGRSLQHLLDIHNLEDRGITEDNLNVELKALVELLQERIHLERVQKIERS